MLHMDFIHPKALGVMLQLNDDETQIYQRKPHSFFDLCGNHCCANSGKNHASKPWAGIHNFLCILILRQFAMKRIIGFLLKPPLAFSSFHFCCVFLDLSSYS